jgi:hypothetical protein
MWHANFKPALNNAKYLGAQCIPDLVTLMGNIKATDS